MARILIIEDNDEVAELFKERLEMAGYEIDRAAAAYGAVIRMLHNHYDLVMMDLLLQGANGAVAALALRGLGFEGPIIVVSGGLMPIDQDVYDKAGFAGRLLKPVRGEDMLTEIERHLKDHGT